MRHAAELLYDSEASLRLVDHAIEELGSEGDDETRAFLAHVMADPNGSAELSHSLLRACTETLGIAHRIGKDAGMLEGERLDDLQKGLEHVATLIADVQHRLTHRATVSSESAVAGQMGADATDRQTA